MERYHQQLLDPSTYPEKTHSVAFKETHISRVYLTDRHAYKIKKPLNLGFLDFSTLAKRHHFCKEEVRLNRRFTRNLYLDVLELRQHNGKIKFGKKGRLLEYAVQMSRLPEDLMLDQRLDNKASDLAEEMPRLARSIQKVYQQAEICQDEAVPNLTLVARNCEENFAQTEAAIGGSLSREAHQLAQQTTQKNLAELKDLFIKREEDGYVRDGHGDLHSGNICMTDPISIYDCIEFNRRFRVADIVADMAFLLMDLEFRERRDLAQLLVRHYQDHAEDRDFDRLLPFYKAYRAWVRGKIEAILATDDDAPQAIRVASNELAMRHFNLALGYHLQPTLFLTIGLMGVGKTTLSRALAQATGAIHLRSDIIRKEQAKMPCDQTSLDDYAMGIYSRDMTEKTYSTLYQQTAKALSASCSVIVDASFSRQYERSRFMACGQQAGVPVWLLHLDCAEDVAMHRLKERRNDISDGRQELYVAQKNDFAPVTLDEHVVAINTNQPFLANVQSLLCRTISKQEQSR